MKAKNLFSPYLEFISEKIYEPSYLSLDYILSENEILTEMPKNFTLISTNKTKILTNSFGNFIYHKIKNKLFIGFKTEKIDNFFISKATKSKALFELSRKMSFPFTALDSSLGINFSLLSLRDPYVLVNFKTMVFS